MRWEGPGGKRNVCEAGGSDRGGNHRRLARTGPVEVYRRNGWRRMCICGLLGAAVIQGTAAAVPGPCEAMAWGDGGGGEAKDDGGDTGVRAEDLFDNKHDNLAAGGTRTLEALGVGKWAADFFGVKYRAMGAGGARTKEDFNDDKHFTLAAGGG